MLGPQHLRHVPADHPADVDPDPVPRRRTPRTHATDSSPLCGARVPGLRLVAAAPSVPDPSEAAALVRHSLPVPSRPAKVRILPRPPGRLKSSQWSVISNQRLANSPSADSPELCRLTTDH